ncbi:RloB family protein [Deinococcus sp. LM3]|uniref:RloB family protein n=1 Tax=Deinococcus sp. LM3 TaxID=1938608 RepID=UPI000992B915|nr:RloB family protein [Deinococcus sp. LM3]OOV14433.1 hypothetical protein BXU09_06880 [Deinococcus sp. LM3]
MSRGNKAQKAIGSARKQRSERRTYLIVCEGEKTEPNYFKEMRQHHRLSIAIEPVGTGYNTISLIDEAERLHTANNRIYEQVWCVFDKDDFPDQNFTNAIQKALSKGFRVAWSNESFELWYLLHYRFTTAHLPRSVVYTELSTHFGKKYDKNIVGLYKILLQNQKTAIQNADNLESTQTRDGKTPAQGNPWTLVHHLVKELLAQEIN